MSTTTTTKIKKTLRKKYEIVNKIPCSQLLVSSTSSTTSSTIKPIEIELVSSCSDTTNNKNNSIIGQLSCTLASNMSINQINQCYTIFESNMKQLYELSSWGYNKENKLNEFQHSTSRYLILSILQQQDNYNNNSSSDSSRKYSNNNRIIIGFIHFRFDYNDDSNPDDVVLYIYEIQVHTKYQSKYGIGTILMNYIESFIPIINSIILIMKNQLNVIPTTTTTTTTKLISTTMKSKYKYKSKKKKTAVTVKRIDNNDTDRRSDICCTCSITTIMLTVFANNIRAIQFYIYKMKYTIDKSSPCQYINNNTNSISNNNSDNTEYIILSKKIIQ